MKKWLVLLLILSVRMAHADPTPPTWDEDRLSGFAGHKKEDKVLDQERKSGRKEQIADKEAWEVQRLKSLAEYKKQAKAKSMPDDGPEARADAAAKKKVVQEYNKIRVDYVERKIAMLARKKANARIVSEMEELDLHPNLPRYDIRDRALYGAKGLSKGSSTAGGGSSGGSPSYNNSPFENSDPGTGYFPPAPTMGMEDGGGTEFEPPPPGPPVSFENPEGGEFPPPPPSPDFGELPPPTAFPTDGP